MFVLVFVCLTFDSRNIAQICSLRTPTRNTRPCMLALIRRSSEQTSRLKSLWSVGRTWLIICQPSPVMSISLLSPPHHGRQSNPGQRWTCRTKLSVWLGTAYTPGSCLQMPGQVCWDARRNSRRHKIVFVGIYFVFKMNSFMQSEQINAHSLDACLLVSGQPINQLARVMRWRERVTPGRCETLDYCQQSRSRGVVLRRADMLLRRLSRRSSVLVWPTVSDAQIR